MIPSSTVEKLTSRVKKWRNLMAATYKPANRQDVVPYLVVPDADKELAFVKKVFGATEVKVFRDAEGLIRHAELSIGDSAVMVAQSGAQWPALPAAIYVYVPDVDAAYERALTTGVSAPRPPADQPYGDRNCGVTDTNGVQWWITTHLEDVSEAELQRREVEALEKGEQTA
jgi:PhnB protein